MAVYADRHLDLLERLQVWNEETSTLVRAARGILDVLSRAHIEAPLVSEIAANTPGRPSVCLVWPKLMIAINLRIRRLEIDLSYGTRHYTMCCDGPFWPAGSPDGDAELVAAVRIFLGE